jgi:hypothetical protein
VAIKFAAPHRHMPIDVTVTSTRANSNVPAVGAPLPLPGTLAYGYQPAKVDADLRTPSI